MAFFYPATVGAAAWALGSYVYSLKQKQRAPVLETDGANPAEKPPFRGAIGHVSQWVQADTRQFRSVEEGIDERGARIFLVDYGSGAKTIQYIDPRILL